MLPSNNFPENRNSFWKRPASLVGEGRGCSSGFWKLLSSLENNFQRPEVLLINYLIIFILKFCFFKSFSHMQRFHIKGFPDF
jgi:hypothetical protein